MSTGSAEAFFVVVENHEGQRAVWPAYRSLPEGWRETAIRGTEAECLASLEQGSDDVLPVSARR